MSQIIVKLELIHQVDPAEDKYSQSQSQHYDEGHRSCMALVLSLVRSWNERSSASCWFPAISLALLAVLLGPALPGAERTTGAGVTGGLGLLYSWSWCW